MKKTISALLAATVLSVEAFAAPVSDWASDGFKSANVNGLLSYSIVSKNLQDNITREEFAELAVNLYTGITQKSISAPEENPFPDTQSAAAARAYKIGIVSGDEKGCFLPENDVTRQEMAKMLYNTLSLAGADISVSAGDRKYIEDFEDESEIGSWAKDAMASMNKYGLMNGVSDKRLAPAENATREQAIVLCARCHSKFSGRNVTKKTVSVQTPKNNSSVSGDVEISWKGMLDADIYHVIIKNEKSEPVYIWQTKETAVTVPSAKLEDGGTYTLIIGVLSNNGTETFSNETVFEYSAEAKPSPTTVPSPEPTAKPSPTPVPAARAAETEKEKRVFPQGTYFVTSEEAEQNMTEITINVWNIGDDGEKIAAERTLTVNSALADEVKTIFDEIFAGEEKFPIYSIGGYTWRKSASVNLSQHSYGTCIDINPNENYQIKNDGTILSGSLWQPEESPYSIAEDGEVVEIFAKHGWAWGGNAWNSSKDYMHFTYLGN